MLNHKQPDNKNKNDLSSTRPLADIVTEAGVELQRCYKSLPELRRQVQQIASDDYDSWDVGVSENTKEPSLVINLYPVQGVHILEDTVPIEEHFEGKILNGFPIAIKYANLETSSLTNSLSLETASFQRRFKHAPITMFMTKEALAAVKELRSHSTHEQIELVRTKERPDDPYTNDEAARVGHLILDAIPFPELKTGGSAVPTYSGGLELHWCQRNYDVLIQISPDGSQVEMWLCYEEKQIDIQSPPMSTEDFFTHLDRLSSKFGVKLLSTENSVVGEQFDEVNRENV